MEIIGYVALIFIGIVLGCIGAGGSMLAIPVLVGLFSLDAVSASAYALFVVGITSLAGALGRQQHINYMAALLFGIPSIALSFAARRWIVERIPDVVIATQSITLMKDDLLLITFSCLMIASSLVMSNRSVTRSYPGRTRSLHLLPSGIFVGFVAGTTGIGGGFMIVPALTFAGLRLDTAIGTTLIIIAANSLVGFYGHLSNHAVDWAFLLGLTGCAYSGLLFGSWLHRRTGPDYPWRKLYGWLALATGIGILVWLVVKMLGLEVDYF